MWQNGDKSIEFLHSKPPNESINTIGDIKSENQVWAAYDDDDGMPRFHAKIHSVISLKPFKIRIGWLNSKSNSELAPLNWIGSGFYKTTNEEIHKYDMVEVLEDYNEQKGVFVAPLVKVSG
ncbi:hypothetical protein PTKIN_Ptkin09bG0243700 [Pterospermum kingtungense]